MRTLTNAEAKFVDQMTRKLLVDWCNQSIQTERTPMISASIYREYALTKKWVSAKDGKILASGWSTAASFLKR